MASGASNRSDVAELLDKLAEGKVQLGEVVADFASRSWPPGPAAASGPAQAWAREQQDPEPPPPGSWAEVEAAYTAGRLTDAQYTALFQARASAARTEHEGR